MPLHMATVLTFPERVTEYSLAKLKQRVAAGGFFVWGGGGGAVMWIQPGKAQAVRGSRWVWLGVSCQARRVCVVLALQITA